MEFNKRINIDKIELPQDPIFLVGFPRSGTTLLQSLLATQKNIYSLPETHFFRIISQFIETDENNCIEISCLHQAFKEIKRMIGLEFPQPVTELLLSMAEEKKLDQKKLFEIVVFPYLYDQVHGYALTDIRWLEKTPSHFYVLDKILTLYPDAQIVIIIRNPIAAIYSRKKSIPQEKNYSVDKLAHQWNEMIKLTEDFRERYQNSIYVLKYEDLAEKTEDTMNLLCEFLNIEINADQLGTFKDISKTFIQPWETWKNDVKSKEISNTNEFRIKEMSMIDILKIQHITQGNMLEYNYNVLYKNIQAVFILIAYPAYILRRFVFYIERFLRFILKYSLRGCNEE